MSCRDTATYHALPRPRIDEEAQVELAQLEEPKASKWLFRGRGPRWSKCFLPKEGAKKQMASPNQQKLVTSICVMGHHSPRSLVMVWTTEWAQFLTEGVNSVMSAIFMSFVQLPFLNGWSVAGVSGSLVLAAVATVCVLKFQSPVATGDATVLASQKMYSVHSGHPFISCSAGTIHQCPASWNAPGNAGGKLGVPFRWPGQWDARLRWV